MSGRRQFILFLYRVGARRADGVSVTAYAEGLTDVGRCDATDRARSRAGVGSPDGTADRTGGLETNTQKAGARGGGREDALSPAGHAGCFSGEVVSNRSEPAPARPLRNSLPTGQMGLRVQGDAEIRRGGAQFSIERGERQFEALGQFEIGRVVDRQSVTLREARRCTPCLGRRFMIERDGKVAQNVGQAVTLRRIEASTTFGHKQAVEDLEWPQRRGERPGFGDPVEQSKDRRGVLILEAPSERH